MDLEKRTRREDLITRMRKNMKNWGHKVNCGYYNKLWGL